MTQQSPSSKKGLTVGLTAGLLGGAAAGMVFGVPGMSSAADSDIEPAAIVQQVDDGAVPTAPDERPDPGAKIRDLLQALVDDGTINADQADSVSEHLATNRPDRARPHGRHGGGVLSETVTDVLGVDAEELRAQLSDGSSLADIATANGVDPQTLIDTLVDEAQSRIDAAIESGKVDAERAAERSADLEQRITDRVNGEGGDFGRRGPRGGFPGGPGPAIDAEG